MCPQPGLASGWPGGTAGVPQEGPRTRDSSHLRRLPGSLAQLISLSRVSRAHGWARVAYLQEFPRAPSGDPTQTPQDPRDQVVIQHPLVLELFRAVAQGGIEHAALALLAVPGDGELGGAVEGVAAQIDHVVVAVAVEDVELVDQGEGGGQ